MNEKAIPITLPPLKSGFEEVLIPELASLIEAVGNYRMPDLRPLSAFRIQAHARPSRGLALARGTRSLRAQPAPD
jgi:hypothetical protein